MSSEDRPKLNQKASATLYLAATSALLGAIGMGYVLGWTAQALPSMGSNSSVPQLLDSPSDKDAKSWIGSSMTLGALVGALLSGPCAQILGRKKALIVYGLPFTLGWLILFLSKSVSMLILGRVVCGFSAGIFSGTAPSYIVEISIIDIRGFLGACFQVCVTIGILLVYVFGAVVDWRVLAAISMIPTLLMAILMFFMPETPSWLLSKKRNEDAKKSLKALRGPDSDNDQELYLMQEQSKDSRVGKEFSFSSYSNREHYCPLLLTLALMFFQQFSGINAVMFYATDIFAESGSSISPEISSIIIGISQVIATVIGSLLVDRLGRKVLLYLSGILHVISLSTLGLYYFAIDDSTSNSFGWVPIVSLVLFIIGFSIGYGPIPWLMTAEIPPSASRSYTSAIATAANWTFAFLITKNFESVKKAITKQGVFFLFGLFSFLSVLFVFFFLPETKGKSEEEIEAFFKPNTTGNLLNQKNSNNQRVSDKVELEKLNS